MLGLTYLFIRRSRSTPQELFIMEGRKQIFGEETSVMVKKIRVIYVFEVLLPSLLFLLQSLMLSNRNSLNLHSGYFTENNQTLLESMLCLINRRDSTLGDCHPAILYHSAVS